jgi:transposase InsO family protein
MPWRELSIMDQREEFVRLALQPGAKIAEVCRRCGISREKGYKWLQRFAAEGRGGLADRSRRPHNSPYRTDPLTEAEVLRIREQSNNCWGGRKIARVMENCGWREIPSASTITEVLRRHGRLDQRQSAHPGPYQRFEYAAPNDLWQMDFKGHFPMAHGRCHPLTVLDDHSRYNLGLRTCGEERDAPTRNQLTNVFRRYGLPFAMLMDNGPPWGDSGQPYTAFSVWLMLLGIRVIHGKPHHPQTQGKDERFHRTLKAEVLDGKTFRDLEHCQSAFDRWRCIYNHERPHQALEMATPDTRYRFSERRFAEQLPPIEYLSCDIVRKVDVSGFISFKNREWRIGKAFRHYPVALRPTQDDGIFAVFFCAHRIATIELRGKTCGFMDIADAMPTTPQANSKEPSKNSA